MQCFTAQEKEEKQHAARQELPIVEHTWPVQKVERYYGTSASRGLSEAQVLEARARYGENRIAQQKGLPAWLRYLLAYADFFSLLLLFGGVLCLVAYALDRSDQSNLYLGIVLLLVVVLSATFGYVQGEKAHSLMQGFKDMVPRKCRAIRDGAPRVLDAWELVPGDVVQVAAGDLVPGDLRIIEASGLRVDNSPLTGESEALELGVTWPGVTAPESAFDEEEPIVKQHVKGTPAAVEAPNLAFFSTTVVGGHGTGIVIGTGSNTVMGQIANLATEVEAGESIISKDVNGFIQKISMVAIVIGLVFMGIGIGLGGQSWVQAIVLAIGVVVATVPEGLLVTFTVSLALTARRMHAVNVLVKNTQSVETLGSTSLIASDKTGTLTQNRMTVQHCWYDGRLHRAPAYKNNRDAKAGLAAAAQHGSAGSSSDSALPHYDIQAASFQQLQMIATLCNSSDFDASKLHLGYGKKEADGQGQEADQGQSTGRAVPAPPVSDVEAGLVAPDVQPAAQVLGAGGLARQESGLHLQLRAALEDASFNLLQLQCTGDASESALIKFAQPLRDVSEFRNAAPKLFEIKFNSTNKWALSIHLPEGLQPGDEGRPLLLLKGAPEQVWKRCSSIMVGGQAVPVTPEHEASFEAAYHELGSRGERVLGFACRSLDLPRDHPFTDEPSPNFPTDGLTFVGLTSLMDPPREGVKEAVAQCHAASVKVFMVTGDHPITARAIAQQIGIMRDGALEDGTATVVTGDDIRDWEELPPTECKAAWDAALAHRQVVFARVTPAHKLMIVEHAQGRGEVVAVTGDGVNDAPALKKADVGLAMGIAGKDVTKEAADLLLMDDNFASIVAGVSEGRLIYDNLKKSIAYTLTSKLPELTPFLVYIIGNLPLPLSTILILAIDLGTDILPAIGLAYETREANIMDRPPRNPKKDRLVSKGLLSWSYPQIGLLQACAGFFAYLLVMNGAGYKPYVLPGTGRGWHNHAVMCAVYADGSVHDCGYGCGPLPSTTSLLLPDTTSANYSLLLQNVLVNNSINLGQQAPQQAPVQFVRSSDCTHGCPLPTLLQQDPFISVTPQGFRGFAAGVEAVCGRSCDWYAAVSQSGKRQEYLQASRDPASPLRLILTEADDALLQQYCKQPGSESLGFKGRQAADPNHALPGAQYYWDGRVQPAPNMESQRHALAMAQSAFFVAVVVCKVVTALCAKTRVLSLFQHGLLGNTWLLGALVAELCITALLVFAPPLNVVFGTAPVKAWQLALGLPWALLIFLYDEGRKLLLRRQGPGSRFYRAMHY